MQSPLSPSSLSSSYLVLLPPRPDVDASRLDATRCCAIIDDACMVVVCFERRLAARALSFAAAEGGAPLDWWSFLSPSRCACVCVWFCVARKLGGS